MYKYKVLIFLFLTILFSCTKESENNDDIENIIHLSHCKKNEADTEYYAIDEMIDTMVMKIDFSNYSVLLLGGDLAKRSSVDNDTISFLDSIFNFSSDNTLWALGNHDYNDTALIKIYTHKPTFYAYYKNGITYIVFDTQKDQNQIINEQREMFDNVVDTINNSSHLIIIHHIMVWMYGNSDLEPSINDISNGVFGTCSYCLHPNNFYDDIYPSLVEVKQKGIEVICIAGDIGMRVDKFEYTTNDNIHFLASGIRAGYSDSKVLIFKHNLTNKELTWDFKLLSEL